MSIMKASITCVLAAFVQQAWGVQPFLKPRATSDAVGLATANTSGNTFLSAGEACYYCHQVCPFVGDNPESGFTSSVTGPHGPMQSCSQSPEYLTLPHQETQHFLTKKKKPPAPMGLMCACMSYEQGEREYSMFCATPPTSPAWQNAAYVHDSRAVLCRGPLG
mmetsp:Transcript_14416/g.25362  ORF Transcript_14416/g.25362 Transcript_14416/m.25362 type:complete len:163 (+) Transcript_14416:51-539(+)